MNNHAGKNRRRSIRLAGYDYSQIGAYFVTVCTYHREHLFGKIENEQAQVTHLGVENVTILGADNAMYFGGLCAYNKYGIIDHCYTTGLISGGQDTGGLCVTNR